MNSAGRPQDLALSVHEDWDSLPVSPTEWNALALRGTTRSVFQTFEWNAAWLGAFGGHWRPLTVIVRRGVDLESIAPFVVARKAGLKPHVALQGHGNADYQDLVGATGNRKVVELVLREVASRLPGCVVDLAHVPADSPTIAVLPGAARAADLWPLRVSDAACPTLLLREHEAHAKRMLAKYSLRRPVNYFSRQGPVTTRRFSSEHEALAELPTFFDQHVRRWGHTDTPSPFRHAEYRHFFREMVLRLTPTGWLDFSVVRLGGRPLAYHFGFRYEGALTWYKPSFEPAEARHSPGLLMIRHLIERALDEGLDELDFTIGTEQFKARYTNYARSNVSWRIYANHGAWQAARMLRGIHRLGARLLNSARDA